MGSKFFIALPPSIRVAAKALGVGALFAALSSCISDGPNRTGGDYLAENGILLKNPLYHVTIPEFPVDSFWTSDAENHFGDTVMMAGISGKFNGQVRAAFDMADTNYLDSVSDSASSFRLSLGTIPEPVGIIENLQATVTGDSAHPVRDSLTFLVESWAIPDTASTGARLTDAQRADTLNVYNRRFLVRQDTTAVLPKPNALDTIVLAIKGAYGADSVALQARALRNLFKLIHPDSGFSSTVAPTSIKWLIQFQLTPLPGASTPGDAMLRLDGAGTSYFAPTLLFGNPTNSHTFGNRGVNYKLRYGGSRFDILPSKLRSLHVVLGRGVLLDSVDAALKRQGVTPPARNISGKFDLSYFLPFGQVTLPLSDSVQLEGDLPLEMLLTSDIDSVLPYVAPGSSSIVTAPLGKSTVLFTTSDRNAPNKVLDTISVFYGIAQQDTGLRQVIIKLAKDSVINDTTYLRVGEAREIRKQITGYGNDLLVLTVTASDTTLEVSHYIASPSSLEANDLRDPSTGKLLSALADKVPRLLHSEDKTLTLRATHGIQRLLNRADADKDIFPELQFQPPGFATVDTSVPVNGTNIPVRLPYPVLSVIPPKIVGGRIVVGLDLYLYPLKKEH
jgi:hypothetical protein